LRWLIVLDGLAMVMGKGFRERSCGGLASFGSGIRSWGRCDVLRDKMVVC